MSTADKLTYLSSTKTAIKQAIIDKGVEVADDTTFREYATKISQIQTGGTSLIYGFTINKTESDPYEAVTYTDDCINFTPAYMDFDNDTFVWGDWQDFVEELCRPCILNEDGTVEYYLDRDNQTLKADGTAVGTILDTQSYMVEFKKMYIYAEDSEDYNTIKLSFSKIDDNYVAWNWCNETGLPQDVMYMPMFCGSIVNDKLKSIPLVTPMVSKNGTAEKGYVEANGTGWYLETAHSRFIKMYLCYLLGHSLNTQSVFGEGYTSGSAVNATGSLIEKGAFYGGASSAHVKTFFCEDWWGNRWSRCEGMVINNFVQYIKNYPPFNFSGTDYTEMGTQPNTNNYLKTITTTENGITINAVGGSTTTYFADYYYQSSGLKVPVFGGGGYGSDAGVAYWHCHTVVSYAGEGVGASPYFIPLS